MAEADEELSLAILPDVQDEGVQSWMNKIPDIFMAKQVLLLLSIVGRQLHIATNATARNAKTLTKAQNALFSTLKLCDAVSMMLQNFQSGSNNILEKLKIAYLYLLDGFPDFAKTDIDAIAKDLGSMNTSIEKTQGAVKETKASIGEALAALPNGDEERRSVAETQRKVDNIEREHREITDEIRRREGRGQPEQPKVKEEVKSSTNLLEDCVYFFNDGWAILITALNLVVVLCSCTEMVSCSCLVAAVVTGLFLIRYMCMVLAGGLTYLPVLPVAITLATGAHVLYIYSNLDNQVVYILMVYVAPPVAPTLAAFLLGHTLRQGCTKVDGNRILTIAIGALLCVAVTSIVLLFVTLKPEIGQFLYFLACLLPAAFILIMKILRRPNEPTIPAAILVFVILAACSFVVVPWMQTQCMNLEKNGAPLKVPLRVSKDAPAPGLRRNQTGHDAPSVVRVSSDDEERPLRNEADAMMEQPLRLLLPLFITCVMCILLACFEQKRKTEKVKEHGVPLQQLKRNLLELETRRLDVLAEKHELEECLGLFELTKCFLVKPGAELDTIVGILKSSNSVVESWYKECKEIIQPSFASKIKQAGSLSDDEMNAFWNSMAFKKEVVGYYCRWKALQVYCSNLRTDIRGRRKQLEAFYVENLRPDEAVDRAWEDASASDMQDDRVAVILDQHLARKTEARGQDLGRQVNNHRSRENLTLEFE